MQDLLKKLDSFDAASRCQALAELLAAAPAPGAPRPWVNMHMHTFFSFNGDGWSPSRLAWEARRQGLYAIGICDFDVLAGLGELIEAGDRLGLRVAGGFESRTFFAEYASQEINSPGEPGVFYFMGMGFVREPAPETAAGRFFAEMLAQSHARNRDLIARINAQLGGLDVDYERDVIPLTPKGNATERHIVRAYYDKALAVHAGDLTAAAGLWAAALKLDAADAAAKIKDTNGFLDLLRSKLMKKGGPGYVQPTPKTFPSLDRVIGMILECEALPMSTWLDGTSSGESDPRTQLECLIAKGVVATNIIPDRNWNLKDAAQKARKVAELHRYARVAEALDLPINVGTELNKAGQRFVDDFDAEPLKPLLPAFERGAQVMVGQTRLMRYAGFSYTGKAAAAEFPARKARNAFFAAVGGLPCPDAATRQRLVDLGPDKAYASLCDSARVGVWR